jgi:hypothetical protein
MKIPLESYKYKLQKGKVQSNKSGPVKRRRTRAASCWVLRLK